MLKHWALVSFNIRSLYILNLFNFNLIHYSFGSDKRQRKVIPCLYEKCQLPPQLEYMVILDYNRVGLYNFWKKLRDSVETTNKINESANISPVKENQHNTSDTYDKSEKDKENTKNVESLEIQKLQLQDSKEAFNMKENLDHSQFDNIHQSKDNHKKQNHFLQWTKKKLSKKGEDNKKEYAPITETVSLPSIENLDSLSTSTDLMEKKPKTKFMNKYVKKVQLKKILVKS